MTPLEEAESTLNFLSIGHGVRIARRTFLLDTKANFPPIPR